MHPDYKEAEIYLDIFNKGYTLLEDPNKFISSSLGRYLSMVYGDLFYTEEPCSNFLNVYRSSEGLILSDSLFFDRFPDKEIVGKIIPKKIFKKLKRDERGGQSESGKKLSKDGYIIFDFDMNSEILHDCLSLDYKDMEHKSYNFKHIFQASKNVCHDINIEKEEDIINIIREKGSQIDKTENSFSHTHNVLENVTNLMADNYFMSNNLKTYTEMHRMVRGNVLDCHIDAHPTGYDDYYMTHVTWYSTSYFEGRDLYCGIRDNEDFLKIFKNGLKWASHEGKYNPENYQVKFKFKPENNKAVLLNTFNPLMCHGVTEMVSGDPVYSLICNLRAKHGTL